MKILTSWLRAYLPSIPVSDRQLADDLTLRGIAVEGVHPLTRGHLFEMDITTNRVDAMNHYGIAREAATIYDLPLSPLLEQSGHLRYSEEETSSYSRGSFPIRNEAPGLCGRFTGRVLRDVTIAPSGGEIKTFFDLLGEKAISNAVDASNFTLLGMGHPTHAFDLDKIEGGIVVRLARPGEKLKLLDGTERNLEPDDLIIADEQKALSLAGVMGGWSSMITPATTNIFLESAWFDPASIRRSSRRHLLHTDASHRFERGADFNAAPIANHLVTNLILAGGGQVDGELIDIIDAPTRQRTAERPPIVLSLTEVRRQLGTTLDDTHDSCALTSDLVERYLSGLGCNLEANDGQRGGTSFSVTLPSWRLDLDRPIDLIEEIARVYGYNRFANTLPTPLPVTAHTAHAPEHAVRTRLLALGFSETVSSTFSNVPDSKLFSTPEAHTGTGRTAPAHVALENPLSEDAANLRPSLLPGMLSMIAGNLNRDVSTARLFEQGEVFTTAGATADAIRGISATQIRSVLERPSLSLGLTIAAAQATSLHTAADAPIFELKGAIESLASLFTLPGGIGALSFVRDGTPEWLEPGRSATVHLGTQVIAYFGELAHIEATRRKLRQPVFLASVDLAELYALPLRKHTAHELSRYQAVERDFSFVFPDDAHWHTVASAIHALSIPELTQLHPVEVWRNEKKHPGVYSLLLRTVFQSNTRTLTDEELTVSSNRIIVALTDLGGTHRA